MVLLGRSLGDLHIYFLVLRFHSDMILNTLITCDHSNTNISIHWLDRCLIHGLVRVMELVRTENIEYGIINLPQNKRFESPDKMIYLDSSQSIVLMTS